MLTKKFNQNFIRQYKSVFAEQLIARSFKEKDTLSGKDILSLSSIKQLNLFIVKALFNLWQKEIKKIESPYFNYKASEVKEAMTKFMNILSQHISIDAKNLKPLIETAVEDVIILCFDPATFLDNEINKKRDEEINPKFIQQLSKYLDLHKSKIIEFLNDFDAIDKKRIKKEAEQFFSQNMVNESDIVKELSSILILEKQQLFESPIQSRELPSENQVIIRSLSEESELEPLIDEASTEESEQTTLLESLKDTPLDSEKNEDINTEDNDNKTTTDRDYQWALESKEEYLLDNTDEPERKNTFEESEEASSAIDPSIEGSIEKIEEHSESLMATPDDTPFLDESSADISPTLNPETTKETISFQPAQEQEMIIDVSEHPADNDSANSIEDGTLLDEETTTELTFDTDSITDSYGNELKNSLDSDNYLIPDSVNLSAADTQNEPNLSAIEDENNEDFDNEKLEGFDADFDLNEEIDSSIIEFKTLDEIEEKTDYPLENPIDVVFKNIPSIDPSHSSGYSNDQKSSDDSSEEKIQSVNDAINDEFDTELTTIAEAHEQQGISSIMDNISINYRYLFVKELFGNDDQKFVETIDKIETFETFDMAVEFLINSAAKEYQWEMSSEEVKELLKIVFRRFR